LALKAVGRVREKDRDNIGVALASGAGISVVKTAVSMGPSKPRNMLRLKIAVSVVRFRPGHHFGIIKLFGGFDRQKLPKKF